MNKKQLSGDSGRLAGATAEAPYVEAEYVTKALDRLREMDGVADIQFAFARVLTDRDSWRRANEYKHGVVVKLAQLVGIETDEQQIDVLAHLIHVRFLTLRAAASPDRVPPAQEEGEG